MFWGFFWGFRSLSVPSREPGTTFPTQRTPLQLSEGAYRQICYRGSRYMKRCQGTIAPGPLILLNVFGAKCRAAIDA